MSTVLLVAASAATPVFVRSEGDGDSLSDAPPTTDRYQNQCSRIAATKSAAHLRRISAAFKIQSYFIFIQIKRPYFHVKPLEAEQLKNWRLYLDFEIAEGNETRITVLFERCLIACAMYDQFWTKVRFYFILRR